MDITTHKRLFIGIPVDALCQQQLDAALAPLRVRDDIRWTVAHNRHLTLAFLGSTSNHNLLTLQEQFSSAFAVANSFRFALDTLARFPDQRGHILAAIAAPSPELLLLYRLTRNLLGRCQVTFEEHEYRPHITVGRISQPRHSNLELQQSTNICLQVDRVNLYESVVRNHGREYEVLSQAFCSPAARINPG